MTAKPRAKTSFRKTINRHQPNQQALQKQEPHVPIPLSNVNAQKIMKYYQYFDPLPVMYIQSIEQKHQDLQVCGALENNEIFPCI
eukprot:gene3356-8270_t